MRQRQYAQLQVNFDIRLVYIIDVILLILFNIELIRIFYTLGTKLINELKLYYNGNN